MRVDCCDVVLSEISEPIISALPELMMKSISFYDILFRVRILCSAHDHDTSALLHFKTASPASSLIMRLFEGNYCLSTRIFTFLLSLECINFLAGWAHVSLRKKGR